MGKGKKVILLLLVAIMIIGLVACSSSNDKPNKGESSENTDKKQKIVAWAWDKNFNVAALEEAKKIYNKDNANVEIEIVEIAQNDVIQKLNTGLSSGTTSGLPNIVLIEDYRIQTFLKAYPGSFKELTDVVKYDDFASYKKDFMTMDGKSYGIPFDTGSAVLYYRKDYVEDAGYTEADMQDLTWEKYIEIGKAIKEKTGKHMLSIDPNDIGLFRIMMQSAGKWYVKEDGSTPDFADNEALKEAAAICKEMLDTGIAKTHTDWAQFVAGPNTGEIASVPTGCWFTPSIMAEKSQSGLWRVAPIPKLSKAKDATNASNLGGSSFYILNEIDGADVATDFLVKTFGSDKSFYETLLDKHGIIATFIPVQSGDVYGKEVEFFGGQKIYSDVSELASKIPSVNYGLHTYAFDDIMKAEFQNIINGTDIDTAMQNAQKQAESQVK
ncbi:ABC transporter substrate-binding protein [Xylanivirga thermophila]|uniref:ABC transporter substrate-binding protein n=1 Tax=Xylanivirga thermophila TaxID=2496273 RepID=UPI00101C1FAD|nr:extracellular solute-binding protein [Xylanivirga thermophila]